jgi:hypothetical protein
MAFRPLASFGPSFAAVLMLKVALRLAVARSLRSCGLCSGVLCRWPSKITVDKYLPGYPGVAWHP